MQNRVVDAGPLGVLGWFVGELFDRAGFGAAILMFASADILGYMLLDAISPIGAPKTIGIAGVLMILYAFYFDLRGINRPVYWTHLFHI